MGNLNAKVSTEIWTAIRHQWRWLALVTGTVFLLGVIILIIYYTTDVNVRVILDDPSETALLPEYAGLYSNIGVIVLWTSAIVGLVSAKFGRFRSRDSRRFLIAYSGIIAFLAMDDLLMFHESGGLILARMTNTDDLARTRSALESIVFAVYILVILVWAWKFKDQIWRSPWPLLVLGGLGFAASIGLDLAPYVIPALEGQPMRVETTMAVAEDLLKMLGIGGLAAFAFALALGPLNTISKAPTEAGWQ